MCLKWISWLASNELLMKFENITNLNELIIRNLNDCVTDEKIEFIKYSAELQLPLYNRKWDNFVGKYFFE